MRPEHGDPPAESRPTYDELLDRAARLEHLADVSAGARDLAASVARFPEENPDPVLRLAHDGVLLYVNPAGMRLLGDLHLAVGAPAPEPLTALARQAQTADRPIRGDLKVGGSVFSLSCCPVGSEVNVYGHDVTARRAAEATLVEREQRLQRHAAELEAVFAAQTDAVIVYGPDGFAVRANAAARELLGFDPVELNVAQMMGRAHATGNPDAAASARALRGETAVGVLIELTDGAGVRRTVSTSSAPMRDPSGRIVGAVSVSRDVTERRRAEAQLRAANERLRESDRRKDEFLAILSHELRNPLGPIRNSTFLLQHAAPASEEARRAREVIERQSAHLARLVDDLLDLNRISRGKVTLRLEHVDLAELARRAAEDHRAALRERGIDLQVEIAPGVLWIHADPTRVGQSIGNLLANARKFTPPGGRVVVRVGAEDGHGVVRVRDTGAGVAPELLAEIFEPFTQAAQTLARSEGGLGLGLALVKAFVEMQGGSVAATSDGLGQGSEFVVRLPLSERAPAAHAVVATPAPAIRLRVLVIEDHADAAGSLKDVLGFLGHEVHVAATGAAGVSAARELRPDLVLCDIGLPDMDGYAVARVLRAEPTLASCRLVALTGYALPEDLAKAKDAGFDEHLAKPPRIARLRDLLAARAPA